jgi:thymidine phosphorylase
MGLIGQTAEIAPADKKIYALRDVTSTVENIGLICASIKSKKLAEGIDALVLDVKTGSGAFMQKEEDAAAGSVDGRDRSPNGKESRGADHRHGSTARRFAGHSHEVIESIEVLRGAEPKICANYIELSAWMFYLGDRTKSVDEGRVLAERLIASGEALEKFKQGITLQGGDARVVDEYERLPLARNRKEVTSHANGYLTATNCMEFGVALAMLGGGREKKEDAIDPAVGLEFHTRMGDRIASGETLVTIHYNSDAKLSEAIERIEKVLCSASILRPPKPRAAAGRGLEFNDFEIKKGFQGLHLQTLR